MAFVKVCGVDELGPRNFNAFYLMDVGVEALILRDRTGELRAYDGVCPHEDYPLVEGQFDGTTITCAAHGWIIDASTGKGVSPASCRIAAYPIKIEGDEIHVDFDVELNA
jgi:toluene monooxygenase system ferredoxin subunit